MELARRWVAALLLAPEEERPAIVDSVERRMVEIYHQQLPGPETQGSGEETETVRLHSAPVQREGFVERAVVTYERAPTSGEKPGRARRKTNP